MKVVKLLFFLFFVILTFNIYAQFPNFRLFPSGTNQIEPVIVRHPLNQQILFASSFTINVTSLNEGVYVSTNSGVNWTGSDVVTGTAPSSHGGDPGPIIDKDGKFILTHQGGISPGMFSNSSTTMGSSWTATITIASGDQNKGSPQTDDVPLSPYYGRTYLVWTRFVNPTPIVIAQTTNGAASWTPFVQINSSPAGRVSYGPVASISINGEVCVSWASCLNTSPFTEDCIGFAKSINAGANWTVSECAFDCNGISASQFPPWNIRVNSFPTMDIDKSGGIRNGWIYIATTDKNLPPSGSDPDIIFHRSTNGGTTWSAGVRVNQDALNNGRVQFFPAMRVDEDGGINVVYYDNRVTPDSVDLYLSRSIDGGSTWADFRVTERRFRPRPVVGSQGIMGDNIGITSGNGNLYPVWMSDISGNYQVWSAIINYATIGIEQIGNEIPMEFELSQNYPNPFNPNTKIEFSIPESGFVVLKVYDITGKTVKILAEQNLKSGKYSVNWDAADYPSGIYFYSLNAGSYTQSKKMILVK